MENKLLSEINSMRSMMGLINEAEEMASQAADLSKAQSLAKLEGLNIDIKNFLDKTNPMCKCPKTGNEEQDGILKKIWSWANDPANKGKLKDTFTKVKSELSQAKKESKGGEISEQLAPIVIGTVTIGPGLLIAIGIFILIILIVAMMPKKTRCQTWKTVDDLV
jgi:hypothetical protein